MSATLVIREGEREATWMPPSWVHDAALDHLAHEVEAADAALAAELRAGVTGLTGGYFSLEHLAPDRLRLLVAAADAAIEAVHDRGAGGFDPGASFVPFLYMMSELAALLRVDPRLAGGDGGRSEGTLVIADGVAWSAEGWIFGLAVEHIGAASRSAEPLLSGMLLHARTPVSVGDTPMPPRGASLSMFSAERYRAVLPAATYMLARYGKAQNLSAYAPSFYADLAGPVRDLASALLSDPRATY